MTKQIVIDIDFKTISEKHEVKISGIKPSSKPAKTCDVEIKLSNSPKILKYMKTCNDALKMLKDYFQNSVSVARIDAGDLVSSYGLRFTCLDNEVSVQISVFFFTPSL